MTTNRLGWVGLIALTLIAARPASGPGTTGLDWAPLVAIAAVNPGADLAADEVAWYARRYRISQRLARTIWLQAREHRIDPGIVFGLVAAESRFDPTAVGRQGERGLMQIKLATARVYERRVTPEALFRPEANLRLGILHLKREVEYFGYDWTLGLLAYKMGRGRVTRALDRGRLPESDYADRVLAHAREQPL